MSTAVDERIAILEVPQGRYRDLSGMPLLAALKMFAADQVAFYLKYPQASFRDVWINHRSVAPDARCPWGYLWYRAEDGVLRLWQQQIDSSG